MTKSVKCINAIPNRVVSLLSVVGEFTARGVERERRNRDSGAPGEWPSAWAAPESPFRGHRRKEPPFLSNSTRQGDYPQPWVIGYSGGKDSTTVLQLVWKALEGLPAESRQKPVFVIASDTRVETPVIVEYIDNTLGERQLYAMALLRALPQLSGRQLPLAVDTPLARLDEIHRRRLMHDYVPAVSDQVLLFPTDVELNSELLILAEPYLARVYRLDYDPQQGQMVVIHSKQPTLQSVILYRGERNGAIGPDIHGRWREKCQLLSS